MSQSATPSLVDRASTPDADGAHAAAPHTPPPPRAATPRPQRRRSKQQHRGSVSLAALSDRVSANKVELQRSIDEEGRASSGMHASLCHAAGHMLLGHKNSLPRITAPSTPALQHLAHRPLSPPPSPPARPQRDQLQVQAPPHAHARPLPPSPSPSPSPATKRLRRAGSPAPKVLPPISG